MVTVHDVARAAGVSISTVSRALSAPGRVAPATVERVVRAASELGYRPNRAASGLRSGRSGVIGLVVPDLENPYFASVAKGVQARAHTHGRAVHIVDTDESVTTEAGEVRGLAQQTDGVILCSPRDLNRDLAALADRPVVLVNNRAEGLPSVTADHLVGMFRAVAHLRALGHRRVAYVGGPESSWSNRQRREGLRRAAETHEDVEIVLAGAFRPHVEGGRAAADLVVGAGATAVVTYNDLVAIGLMERLRSRGLEVPRDLSVVGCDDTFVAALASPPLTTLSADLHEMGARAVDVLVALLAGEDPPPAGELPVELVVRGSTGVPFSARADAAHP